MYFDQKTSWKHSDCGREGEGRHRSQSQPKCPLSFRLSQISWPFLKWLDWIDESQRCSEGALWKFMSIYVLEQLGGQANVIKGTFEHPLPVTIEEEGVGEGSGKGNSAYGTHQFEAERKFHSSTWLKAWENRTRCHFQCQIQLRATQRQDHLLTSSFLKRSPLPPMITFSQHIEFQRYLVETYKSIFVVYKQCFYKMVSSFGA